MEGVLTPETHWRNEDPSERSLMRQTKTLGTYITSHNSTARTNTKETQKEHKKHKKNTKRTQNEHKRTQKITQKNTKTMYDIGCCVHGVAKNSLWCGFQCGIGACRM